MLNLQQACKGYSVNTGHPIMNWQCVFPTAFQLLRERFCLLNGRLNGGYFNT